MILGNQPEFLQRSKFPSKGKIVLWNSVLLKASKIRKSREKNTKLQT